MSVGITASQLWLERDVPILQPMARTSKPYPLEYQESLAIGSGVYVLAGNFRQLIQSQAITESMSVSPGLAAGVYRRQLITVPVTEAVTIPAQTITAGVLRRIIIQVSGDSDAVDMVPQLLSGVYRRQIISYTYQPIDALLMGGITLLGGSHSNV